MRKLMTLVVLALGLGALATSASGRTDSTLKAVSCGDTLTTSVKLANDLVSCPGTGLAIGANGITVDLNGHTIGGTNAPKSEGIANDGHANVKIVNGTITTFRAYGIALRRARGNSLSKLTVLQIGAGGKQGEASAGILVDHSPSAAVTQSVVKNHVHAFQSDGIDVLSSRGTRIEQNTLAQNAWNGLVVILSPRSRVVGNTLDANGNNGLEANVGSDSVLVSGNRAGGNRNWGIVVGAVRKARVLGNTVSANGKDGLMFFDLAGSLIQHNNASANENGISLTGGQHGSKLNRLAGNTVTKNRSAGIFLTGDGVKNPANDNLLSGNTATRNGKAGGVVIEGTALRNKLRNNTANANAGRGITAVAGSIDAGGNRARGNERSPQCVGVVCR